MTAEVEPNGALRGGPQARHGVNASSRRRRHVPGTPPYGVVSPVADHLAPAQLRDAAAEQALVTRTRTAGVMAWREQEAARAHLARIAVQPPAIEAAPAAPMVARRPRR